MSQQILRALADEVDDSLGSLTRSVEDMEAAKQAAGASPSRVALWACGATLHAFCTGIEKICEAVAHTLNGSPSAGPDWHRRLLRSMTSERPGVRPALISEETASSLDDYLAFRHRFRNLYMFDLRWEPIKDLLDRAPGVWTKLHSELVTFASYLRQIAAD